jgi:hypothetical protein
MLVHCVRFPLCKILPLVWVEGNPRKGCGQNKAFMRLTQLTLAIKWSGDSQSGVVAQRSVRLFSFSVVVGPRGQCGTCLTCFAFTTQEPFYTLVCTTRFT